MKSIRVKSYNKIIKEAIQLDGDTGNWNGSLKKRITDALRLAKECRIAAAKAREKGDDENADWLEKRAEDYEQAAKNWNQDTFNGSSKNQGGEDNTGKSDKNEETAEEAAARAQNAADRAAKAAQAAEQAAQEAAEDSQNPESGVSNEDAADAAKSAKEARDAANRAQEAADQANEAAENGNLKQAKEAADNAQSEEKAAEQATKSALKSAGKTSESENSDENDNSSSEDSSDSTGGKSLGGNNQGKQSNTQGENSSDEYDGEDGNEEDSSESSGAERASKAADKAKQAADKAQAKAEAAQKAADEAKANGEDSSEAQDKADEAKANAEKAKNAAEKAKQHAEAAKKAEEEGDTETANSEAEKAEEAAEEASDAANESSDDEDDTESGSGKGKGKGKSGKSSSSKDDDNSAEETDSDDAPVKDPFADDEDIPSLPKPGQQGQEPRDATVDDIIKQLTGLKGEAKRGAIDGLTDLVNKKNESLTEAFDKSIREYSDEEWDALNDETIEHIAKAKKIDTVDTTPVKVGFKGWANNKVARQELEDEENKNAQQDILQRRAKEQEIEKYSNLDTMQDFEIDFEGCIRDQVEMVMKEYQDYSEINPEYEDEDIIMKADVTKIIPSEDIPTIAVFYDKSGSCAHFIPQCNKAIATVKQKYVDTGVCKMDLYYFGDIVVPADSGLYVGGSTDAWPDIINTIKKGRYNNVLVMSDSDIGWQNNHGESWTVEGCVWWIWREGNRADNCPKQLVGMQHNFECAIY